MATTTIARRMARDPAARRAASVALLALLGMGQTVATGGQAVNQQALAVKDYSDRVQRYAELHQKLEAELPELPRRAEPAAIEAHQQALAAKIQAARARAKPGDVFTPEVARQFRRIIRDDLQRRSAPDVRAMFEEVAKGYDARVNARYPTGAPLPTVPAVLLARLQRLPEELEYRLMDHSLILRDTHANIIVDFVDRVVPSKLR